MATRVQRRVQERHNTSGAEERAPARGRYENQPSSDIPVFEWITGAVGFVVVTAAIGFLFYQAVTAKQSPPDVDVRVVSVAQVRSGYLVRARTHNNGGSAAAGVVIQGELRKGTEVVEQSNTTLDYSPPHSEKEIGLFFTRDPREFDLRVRALGYVDP